jgi:Uma2 family endonuclease
MSPVSKEHSDVGLFLLKLVGAFVEARSLGEVLYEPFQMKTGPDLPGRSPDILFVAKANLGRLHPTYLDGPGDLVVEIISPGSRAVDRGEKFYEYEQGGVPEYWLIDPQRQQAEFYQRGADGIYRLAPVDDEGRYYSRALDGLWLNVEWLWQRPLPSLLRVLKEWQLI